MTPLDVSNNLLRKKKIEYNVRTLERKQEDVVAAAERFRFESKCHLTEWISCLLNHLTYNIKDPMQKFLYQYQIMWVGSWTSFGIPNGTLSRIHRLQVTLRHRYEHSLEDWRSTERSTRISIEDLV